MSSDAAGAPDSSDTDAERQRVVRVRGSRRAQLTPAPGTDPTPEEAVPDHAAPGDGAATPAASGPNDERMRQDVPPHY